jgi:5'-3' exonuclease
MAIPTFVFIDGSYFIFYRYYALVQWWGLAKETPIGNPIENEEFILKFKSTFKKSINDITKRLNLPINSVFMLGKDCSRQSIWRNQLHPDYKQTRIGDSNVGPIFKMVYNENLFEEGGINTILEYPGLEADDCIALTTKYVNAKYPEANIYIITSDTDYLQLYKSNVHIYNLKYKPLNESKNCNNNPEKDLFCKTVMGDKSDNIPSIFPKCGIKTALKCYEDAAYFENKLNSIVGSRERLELNRTLIDFNNIPEDLKRSFYMDTLKINEDDIKHI